MLGAGFYAGSAVRAELKNAYTRAQLAAVQTVLVAAQDQWRADYGCDSMPADEWKALLQSENLDGRTFDTIAELLENSDAVLRGTWSAGITVPENTAPAVYTSEHFRVTADSLSVESENFSGQNDVSYMIRLTDGRTLVDEGGTSERQAMYDAGILSAEDTVCEFAYAFGADGKMIRCFSEPVAADEIASVTALLFDYENGVHVTTEELSAQ